MATKKKEDTKKKGAETKEAKDPEKEAKKLARMEKLKNRPAGQRPNSKQIDVIDLGDGNVVKNFGYPIKNKEGHVGVVVTSIAMKGKDIVSTSVSFIAGSLTVKAKKEHGTICSPKSKKDKGGEEDEEGED